MATIAGLLRPVNPQPDDPNPAAARCYGLGMPSILPRPTDHEAAARIADELRIHPVTAQILASRGLRDASAARAFLQPSPAQLHDPALFRDMDAATELVEAAIRAGDGIAIYGDYDVDGVTGTAVLMRALNCLGARTRAFIPHRVDDGYGLNPEALLKLGESDCGLVVTVDNGTTRADAIAEAQARGQRVVVTDHHEPTAEIPPCPVINPKRTDTSYPFDGLAGCGVALKLALGLARRMGKLDSAEFRALLPDLLALVAVGTVADVVPLVDENRPLVSLGLRALGVTQQPGMRALLDVSRCRGAHVRPADVAFRIGPRINAAGRLGSAHLALDLLMCDDPEEAARLARLLDEGNRERQLVERAQAEEAYAMAEESLLDTQIPALVLSDANWHAGVIGIVAARVAETYHKPAALITIEGENARGSARSYGGVRLHEALNACSHLLLTHGGHAYAAGFTLRADAIDAFRTAFQAAVTQQGNGEPGPREVDAELPLEALSLPLAREIELLQPFGHGNDEPIFCAHGLQLAGKPRRMGQGEKHLAFHAATERTSVRAIAFGQADKEPLLRDRFDLAFVLRTGNGAEPYEIHVREIIPHESSAAR